MKKCEICKIIKNPITIDNTIIYENENIIVKAAKGMVVSGHLLIIPKIHINGMAELELESYQKIYKFCKRVTEMMKKITGEEVILFEHGSLPLGRHPESIVHAHLHIIPVTLSKKSLNDLITGCKLKKVKNIENIIALKNKDYWFFEDSKENIYMSYNVENVPRSIIFKIIAIQNGLSDKYEWREESNNDIKKLKETFKIGNELFNMMKKN